MSLTQHSLIITVNRRLARILTEQYSEQQMAAGHEVWETPDILPWSSWLSVLWRQSLQSSSDDAPQLMLNKLQMRAIWEGVLRASDAANGLLQIGETTRVVMEAWRLLHEYDLSLEQITNTNNSQSIDTQVFVEWANEYQKQIKNKNWLDPSLMPAEVIKRIEAGKVKLPQQVLLAGFDELTPLQQKLLNLLMANNCRVQTYQGEDKQANVVQLACQDTDHELTFAAARTRYLLEQNPRATVGIVVPDLHKRKTQIQAMFEDVLLPERVYPSTETRSPFNISLGDPLTVCPMIKTAFQILTAAKNRLTLEDLSRLIRSPFLAGAEVELSNRSLLDAQLRQFGDDAISLSFVMREAGNEERRWYCPKLLESLEKLQALTSTFELSTKNTIVEWVELFDQILEVTGWPGERQITSVEYQTIESWRSVREQCVSLDTVTSKMSYNVALQHLRKTANEQTFQAEGSDVPIQVLGMLEAAGLEFDELIVLGMTDEQWPAKPSPNPFLPLQIQRKNKIAHASAEVELQSARVMTERLLLAAKNIIFTYPKQQADQMLRPSPLIKGFEVQQLDDVPIRKIKDVRRQMLTETALEKYVDNQAQALPDNVDWSGGVSLFKDQAACPFRAFVKHRLRAQPLGVAESGLSPAERGSLVHDSLENLWKYLQTHDRLIKISSERLKEVIEQSVEAAIKEFHSGKSVLQEAGFKNLEVNRLKKLLNEWLDEERKREAFSIEAVEHEMEMKLGGIKLTTRVDRIDRLETGELALIDYKTGDVSTKSWEGSRPDEPQLPVYAVGMHETPKAILFGKVKKGEQGFVGVSDELNIGKPQESWSEMIQVWQAILENLAKEFMQGHAVVDPKDGTTCQFCTYQSLCRIDEVNEFNVQQAGLDDVVGERK